MSDETEQAQIAHRGAAETIVRLSPTAVIDFDTASDLPILSITDGSFIFLLMPCCLAEDQPLTSCDVRLGSDLVLAATRYRNTVSEAYAKQQGQSLPQRRPRAEAIKGEPLTATRHG